MPVDARGELAAAEVDASGEGAAEVEGAQMIGTPASVKPGKLQSSGGLLEVPLPPLPPETTSAVQAASAVDASSAEVLNHGLFTVVPDRAPRVALASAGRAPSPGYAAQRGSKTSAL
jgi:hypothetical protein